MSREEKGNSSTVTPEAVRTATETHQASRSSPAAVARVRTLQDVQLEIDTEKVKFHKAREQFEKALSGYQTALDASKTNPDNKVLSEELAEAKDFKDSYKSLMEVNAQRLASLETKRAQLQAAANAPTEHKSKFLFCVSFCLCIVYRLSRELAYAVDNHFFAHIECLTDALVSYVLTFNFRSD